jgi:Ca-activated chloride channel homolog
LTDGLANVGILDPSELARHAGQLRRRGIATTTIGVGADFDEGLLSAIAEAGGGNFQYIANPDELRTFFARELQELFTVAATGLKITVTLPHGMTGDLIAAFPVDAQLGSLEVSIGDLPAGDAIDLVFALRASPGEVGDLLPVGIKACWTDARTDSRRQFDASPGALRRSEPEEVAKIAPDSAVAERAALQRAAAERRAGLELDRAGRYAESRQRMARSQAFLQAAPATLEVKASLLESDMLAAAPSTAAYSSHDRKLAQQREELRRRGRHRSPTSDPRESP